ESVAEEVVMDLEIAHGTGDSRRLELGISLGDVNASVLDVGPIDVMRYAVVKVAAADFPLVNVIYAVAQQQSAGTVVHMTVAQGDVIGAVAGVDERVGVGEGEVFESDVTGAIQSEQGDGEKNGQAVLVGVCVGGDGSNRVACGVLQVARI